MKLTQGHGGTEAQRKTFFPGMNVLLSTAYWPNLHYFFYVLNSETVSIEQQENYQKQSYRNRTQILTANGPLDLSIPVKNRSVKTLIKDVEINYTENWQIKHWRAITSAYKNSPYFDFFEEEISLFYLKPYEFLLDYNSQQLLLILNLLRKQKEIGSTTIFQNEADPGVVDLRSVIHPKVNSYEDHLARSVIEKPYYQTFENKFKFCPNLSVLDILFNTGLETTDYLRSS